MGIKGLMGFLAESAPNAISEIAITNLSGQNIAFDVSTALYQFSIAIRDTNHYSNLINSKGQSTSHISGLMHRCLVLLEAGIKPIFVFDSTPPEAKAGTLHEREQRREGATKLLQEAQEGADKEAIRKYVGRTVRVTREQNLSAQRLLTLMGVPIVEAKEEAEAQCTHLVKCGIADAVATEDTDALVFGCKILLRGLTGHNKKLLRVDEAKVLEALGLDHNQFIDFCILCGCDYCGSLRGIGPKTAYGLLLKHKSLEKILQVRGEHIDGYEIAKECFTNPQVNQVDTVTAPEADLEGLRAFLVDENNFNSDRVAKILERLDKVKRLKIQLSLGAFLKCVPRPQQRHPPAAFPKGRRTRRKIDAFEHRQHNKSNTEQEDNCIVQYSEQEIYPGQAELNGEPYSLDTSVGFGSTRKIIDDDDDDDAVEGEYKGEATLSFHDINNNHNTRQKVDELTVAREDVGNICNEGVGPCFDASAPLEPTGTDMEYEGKASNGQLQDFVHAAKLQVAAMPMRKFVSGNNKFALREFATLNEEGPKNIEIPQHLKRFLCLDATVPNPTPASDAIQPDEDEDKGKEENIRFQTALDYLKRASPSFGTSWDKLDELVLEMHRRRLQAQTEWQDASLDIIDYASRVAREKLIQHLGTDANVPPRILRKWTRTLYSIWKSRFMHRHAYEHEHGDSTQLESHLTQYILKQR